MTNVTWVFMFKLTSRDVLLGWTKACTSYSTKNVREYEKVKERNGVIANFTVHKRDRNYYSHLMMRKANQSKVTEQVNGRVRI